MTNDIDTAFLFSPFPPVLQNAMQRVLAATEYHGYRGRHLTLSCGLLCLDSTMASPLSPRSSEKAPGRPSWSVSGYWERPDG